MLIKGVISDDLRNGAFQTCGEVADAMLLYNVGGLIFKGARVSRAACRELDVSSTGVHATWHPKSVGGILWSRSLSWGNCIREEQRKKGVEPSERILEASNSSFLLAFGLLLPRLQSSLPDLRTSLIDCRTGNIPRPLPICVKRPRLIEAHSNLRRRGKSCNPYCGWSRLSSPQYLIAYYHDTIKYQARIMRHPFSCLNMFCDEKHTNTCLGICVASLS